MGSGSVCGIAGIVQAITHLPPHDPRIRLCASSVIGQVLFYRHAQAVVHRLHPEQEFARKDLDALALHITDFSAGALEAIAKGQPVKQNGKRRSVSREKNA